MIRHVALFTWTADATPEQKEKVAAELRSLAPLMRGLRAYHVGPDAGLVEGNFDYAVVADFEDAESYLAYRDHPTHRAVIEPLRTPIRQDRVSIQYQV